MTAGIRAAKVIGYIKNYLVTCRLGIIEMGDSLRALVFKLIPAELGKIVAIPDESLLRYNEQRVSELLRCSQCVLPETFPFIYFDDQGVCNYCHNYQSRYKDMDPVGAKNKFIASLEKYRRSGGTPDALVAFSGGRDSSYGLHLIKREFGLTPITFTYDWGMVTDLARRNVARICGQLGIQNILVSADIKRKKENIRNNVSAWLRRPDLGLVPLFMAGDKHFFRVTNQLKRQTGIALDLWCANPLENTDFKSGFCGIRPDFGKTRLASGEILFGYTDGVVEARGADGSFFSEKQLVRLLESGFGSSEQLLQRISSAVNDHIGNADQFDDITMLAVRHRHAGSQR